MQPKQTSKQSKPKPKRRNKAPASDRRKLLSGDRKIWNLHELIRSAPDIREDRVEDLRKKIRGSTYNIKAEEIAEKIIEDNPLDDIT